jgi:hypothetical protein
LIFVFSSLALRAVAQPGASPLLRSRSGDIEVPQTEVGSLARPLRAA